MRISESYKDYPVRLNTELIACNWDLTIVWIRGDKYTAEEYAKKHGGRFWESTPEGNFLHFQCKETGAERGILQKDLYKRPLTMGDAFNMGYSIAFSAYQNGYISRRKDPEDLKLYAAGGKRRGMIYALAPAYNTTRYCLRFYLEREERKHD